MSKEQEQEKKKGGKLDKLLLGVVIGGAVGSVVGVTLSNKEIREKMRKKIAATSGTLREIVEEKSCQKKSFWHFLNKIFCKKK